MTNVLEAMMDGAKNTLAVALACACAGIIIGMVALTGAGIVFTQAVLGLAQNSLLLALVLTALAGIVLGMGMPTTPAYIVMTALLVPAVIKLGVVDAGRAHVRVLFRRSCRRSRRRSRLPSIAAAGLAKSDLWATGWAAMKIGAAGFIVPFMFVYEPALLMIGDWPTIIWRFLASCFGIMILAAGLHGYFLRRASLWERAVLIAAAFCLVKPGWETDLAGVALCAVVVAVQWSGRDKRGSRAVAKPAAGAPTG